MGRSCVPLTSHLKSWDVVSEQYGETHASSRPYGSSTPVSRAKLITIREDVNVAEQDGNTAELTDLLPKPLSSVHEAHRTTSIKHPV